MLSAEPVTRVRPDFGLVTAHRRSNSRRGAAACYSALVSGGVQLLLGAAGCWWCGGSGTRIDFACARAHCEQQLQADVFHVCEQHYRHGLAAPNTSAPSSKYVSFCHLQIASHPSHIALAYQSHFAPACCAALWRYKVAG